MAFDVATTNRRRPRRKATPADHSEARDDCNHSGKVKRRYSEDKTSSSARPPPPPPPRLAAVCQSAPYVWALLREAQVEMDHGTDVMGDELNKLWRNVREVAGAVIRSGEEEEEEKKEEGRRRRDDVGGPNAILKVRRKENSAVGQRRRREEGGRSTRPRPTLPPEEADALLTGLAQLQSEMKADIKSFRHRKAELGRKLEEFESGPDGDSNRQRTWGRNGDAEVAALQKEAVSMRAGVAASHARLLRRVRELQGLPRRLAAPRGGSSTANINAASTSTGTTAAADRTGSTVKTMSLGSVHNLNDLTDSAKAVVAARNELLELREAVKVKRNELARETSRRRAAGEQASRLESSRSAAAAAAARAKRDTEKARAEAETAAHALMTAREGLAAAEAARRSAETAVESEKHRLNSLQCEGDELEAGLRRAAQEVKQREARAGIATAVAEEEEARLADYKDSFGLEIEGLQKGVGELESEARGWRKALEQARSRLRVEEEEGQAAKAKVGEEKTKQLGEVERLKAEARALENRVGGLRRQRESDGNALARDTEAAAAELSALKSKVAEAHSTLQAQNAELEALANVLGNTASAVRTKEEKLDSLERRCTELETRIGNLKAEKERIVRNRDGARRGQEEELLRWREAVAERREEYERVTELARAKAASLGNLESQADAYIASTRQAHGEHEVAAARAQAALRAAREAAALAERGREKAEREEARAAAAESRTAEAVEQFRRQAAEVVSEKELLGKVLTDLEEARRAAGEVQTETTWTRQELTALSEKRREEESALVGARQRATALAREEASLRAVAATARREGAEGRDAAAAARNELTELLEAVDRERRVLEGFRDQAAVLEANLARKKEEDRFAREAADAQQLRLDEIKREVTLLRDEHLRVEKNVWALKSELAALDTRRDDAARRDRRRDREEVALAVRRDTLADAAAQEEQRLRLAATAKEGLEAEVAELDSRAGTLTAEANAATQEASALREDAATAAGRADEARKQVVALESQAVRLNVDMNAIRATKGALMAELNGLRHELDTLRGDRGYYGSAAKRGVSGQVFSVGGGVSVRLKKTGGVRMPGPDVDPDEISRANDPALNRGTSILGVGPCDDDHHVKDGWNSSGGSCREKADLQRSSGDGRLLPGNDGGGGGSPGNLVEVVAEFQGRLRRQVQAALANAEGAGVAFSRNSGGGREPIPGKGRRIVDAVLDRQAAAGGGGDVAGLAPRRGQHDGVVSSHRGGCRSVLGELGRRVGSV